MKIEMASSDTFEKLNQTFSHFVFAHKKMKHYATIAQLSKMFIEICSLYGFNPEEYEYLYETYREFPPQEGDLSQEELDEIKKELIAALEKIRESEEDKKKPEKPMDPFGGEELSKEDLSLSPSDTQVDSNVKEAEEALEELSLLEEQKEREEKIKDMTPSSEQKPSSIRLHCIYESGKNDEEDAGVCIEVDVREKTMEKEVISSPSVVEELQGEKEQNLTLKTISKGGRNQKFKHPFTSKILSALQEMDSPVIASSSQQNFPLTTKKNNEKDKIGDQKTPSSLVLSLKDFAFSEEIPEFKRLQSVFNKFKLS